MNSGGQTCFRRDTAPGMRRAKSLIFESTASEESVKD